MVFMSVGVMVRAEEVAVWGVSHSRCSDRGSGGHLGETLGGSREDARRPGFLLHHGIPNTPLGAC